MLELSVAQKIEYFKSQMKQPGRVKPLMPPLTDDERQTSFQAQDWTEHVPSDPAQSELAQSGPSAYLSISKAGTFEELLKLDPYEFKIFFYLTALSQLEANKKGRVVRASMPGVAKGTALPLSTVKRAFKKLVERSYVHLMKRDQRKGYLYKIKKVLL